MNTNAAPVTVPAIVDVIVATEPDAETGAPHIVVTPVWSGVDRTTSHSWGLKASHGALAKRLAAALRAGVVCRNPRPATDCNGKTYADFDLRILGRTMNADLKRLGF